MATKTTTEMDRRGGMENVGLWAVCAGAAYALLFLNFTGAGSLWNALIAAALEQIPTAAAPVSTRTYLIPAKPVDDAERDQDRMLMVPDTGEALIVTVADPAWRAAAVSERGSFPNVPVRTDWSDQFAAPRPGLAGPLLADAGGAAH